MWLVATASRCRASTRSLTEARPTAFTTLVLAQLFNSFNARSDSVSALHHLFTIRVLWGAIALSLLLQVGCRALALLQDAFDTAHLSLAQSLLCAGLARECSGSTSCGRSSASLTGALDARRGSCSLAWRSGSWE